MPPTVVEVRRMKPVRWRRGTGGPVVTEQWTVEWSEEQPMVDQSVGATDGTLTTPAWGALSDRFANLYAYDVSVDPGEGDSLRLHVVTYQYERLRDRENQPIEQQPGEPDDPLSRPDRTRRDHSIERVPTYFEVDNTGTPDPTKPITNSAGVAVDPAAEREVIDAVYRITGNRDRAVFTDAIWKDLNGSVNLDVWDGNAAGTCRVWIRVDEATEGGTDYFAVEWEIQVRLDGWDAKYVDEGYVEDSTGDGTWGNPQNAKTDDDEQVTQPVLLNGNGQKLASNVDPVILTAQVHAKKTWGANVPAPTS